MLLSENIYFLVLFTLPAAFYILFNAHIRAVPVVNKNKSVELAECVTFCLVVFFINIFIMRSQVSDFMEYSVLNEELKLLYIQANDFDLAVFMGVYFIINLLSSIFVILLWCVLINPCRRLIVNKYNKKRGRPEEGDFSDVWRQIFETKDTIDVSKDYIVKIEKGNKLITAGVLCNFAAPQEDIKEFALHSTDIVKDIFEEDKEKDIKDRIFPSATLEYYESSKDVLIKFYSADRYEKAIGIKK